MPARLSISFPRFRMFTARRYGLFAVSYRGYGGSSGSPTQSGLLLDGEAAYHEARARGYDGDRIVLMGASLGTGVATALAATHEAAALVLESPYLSALDVASARYAIFPVSWLMLNSSARISRSVTCMFRFLWFTERTTPSFR